MNFSNDVKGYLWQQIIKKKIENQAINLKFQNKTYEYDKLLNYMNNVMVHDETNREGHSAKVYFNALFGKDFSRKNEIDVINKYLNYGYSIILSSINREVKILGYLTELGIHHIGESNSFNLSCDLMEPLRPYIDKFVINGEVNEINYKSFFINILSTKVINNEKEFYLDNAIRLYVEDMMNYLLTGDIDKIKFIKYEL